MTSFQKRLELTGQMPQVRVSITPLGKTRSFDLNYFIEYKFSSSMVIPVDAFSFSFSAPDDPQAFVNYCREGDLVSVYADDVLMATGIADQIEIEVDGESGQKASINGRDLLGQLEDNMAISVDAFPIIFKDTTIIGGAQKLIEGTRIPNQILESDTPTSVLPFSTAPEESRLSALMRLIEPYNCLAWTSPNGNLTIGRPNFAQKEKGTLVCNKQKQFSNVFNYRVTYSSASIANRVIVLWNDVQSTQIGIAENQIFENNASGPRRLYENGHNVIKTVVTSIPTGITAQDARATAEFKATTGNAQIIQALAKRELARQNFNEVLIQCSVPGHFNDLGEMYQPDTCYVVDFDRANINEKMYCYAVEWNLSPERGQYTILSLCKLGTIVSDVRVR